ncbi:glutaredoxin [Alteribacter lacisalsi]|uniref:Glutaredoxin n=1 Tax=Alteribacter lacisalsi TaxID=2045244 RepID=A0A2W0HG72_9BACI|nr:glutaredoxin family protein [Alteribacter lacisalsi]PYZ95799.1 glutaredoxin [Alteribacter lacisalsi]
MNRNLTFYTKKDCPLCEEGLVLLEMLKDEYSFEINEVDIYKDDVLLEKYQIRIPVVEAENGAVVDEGRLSLYTLEKNLNTIFTT